MRQLSVPTRPAELVFRYYCPICGIELALADYESPDRDYSCPLCGTQQRPSRVPAT